VTARRRAVAVAVAQTADLDPLGDALTLEGLRIRLLLLRCVFEPQDPARPTEAERARLADLEARLKQAEPQVAAVRGGEGHPPSKLHRLALTFGLDAFETDVVALCLALRLNPALHRLCAEAQRDSRLVHPTPQLAALLFGPASPAAFLESGRLRSWGLVTLEPSPDPMGWSPLTLDDALVAFLVGAPPAATGVAGPVPPAPLAAQQVAFLEEAAAALAGWLQAAPPVLHLHGPPATGVLDVARGLAAGYGLTLHRIELARLPADAAARAHAIRLLRRDALLHGHAHAIERSPGEEALAPGLDELLDGTPVLTVVTSDGSWRPARPVLSLAAPLPDTGTQAQLWRAALGPAAADLEATVQALSRELQLGPGEMVQAVAAARARSFGKADPEALAEALWATCRERLGDGLRGLAQRIEPRHGWDDLVLPTEPLALLHSLADQAALRPVVHEAWGMGRGGRGLGVTALFSGPSGTGKTLAAEVVAGHLRLDLQRVDLAALVSKYIGETEKNLSRVFAAAERSGAVLFFDEADAIFGKRSEVKDSHDRYANLEVDYLLQRMEEHRGLAILATNRKADLDRAFLRRLRFVMDFPLPDAAARRRIWERLLPATLPTEGLDLDALARLDLAGGAIRNVALNGAFLAAAESAAGPLRMAHLMEAARREYAKADRTPTRAEFGAYAGGKVR
jgi:hypothetical protein